MGGSVLAGGETWLDDFEQAKKEAAKRGVPILADFSGSDWCGWCIRLDKEVFSEKAFSEYAAKNLVLFVADFPQRKKLPKKVAEQNRRLAMRYRVEGFPTVLLLDKKGTLLGRTGYLQGGAKAYVKHVKALLAKAKAKAAS